MTHPTKLSFLAISLASLAALSACGGGGGDAGTPPFGSPSTEAPDQAVAADLLLSLDKTQLENTGSDKVTVTVTAVDAQNRVLPSATVLLSVDANAIVTADASATDATGKLTGTVGIGSSKANRTVNVTATSGAITKKLTIAVTGTKVTAVVLPATVNAGAAGQVTFSVKDNNGTAIASQPITIASPGLQPATATGVTDANGEFVFNYAAPATASGTLAVTGTAAGVSSEQAVQIRGTVVIPDVTTPITSASVQVNPSVVSINQTGTVSRAEVRALFLGADNKPVPNVRVRFDANGDANNIGGTFSSGTEAVISNANGVATSAYIPGARSSPINGVTIRACYGPSDASIANGACPNSQTNTLTVSAEPLGVTIGQDNVIAAEGLTYVKKFVVQVVDASGAAMPDVNLAVSVKLDRFAKGSMAFFPASTGVTAGWRVISALICPGEDANGNGVLEDGEDKDADRRLEPRPSDVSITMLQSRTRADGTAELQIKYPQNFATWAEARITVSANGVVGTEGRDETRPFFLPASADAVLDPNVAPPFVRSPYGVVATPGACSNPN